jgi:uncharacterized protein YjbI with pentapeptide repeats
MAARMSTKTHEPLRPRTVAEEHLYMECHPCPCGDRRRPDGHKLEMRGQEMYSLHFGKCPACGRDRTFEFVVAPFAMLRDDLNLGAGNPSTILDPGQFLAASDRLAKEVDPDRAARQTGEARAWARRTMRRAAYCVLEAEKFIPERGEEVPAGVFHSKEGAELRLARATAFKKERLQARRVAYQTVAAQLHEARGGGGSFSHDYEPGYWARYLDKDVLRRHEAWMKRSFAGDGRIVLVRKRLDDAPLEVKRLAAARFDRCRMTKIDLRSANLMDAELVECVLSNAHLLSLRAQRATFRSCNLFGANLAGAWLDDALIEGGEWREAHLDRATLSGADVEDVDFERAVFGDARLNRTVFVGCSFKDADLARKDTGLDMATTTDAVFIRCDLRGASFEGRRFSGTVFEGCQLDGPPPAGVTVK